MPKRLPKRPNLEHLRTQAKALLPQLRAVDPSARLADAQAAVARRSGFAAWPMLARHVDRLRRMEGTWSYRTLELDGAAVPAAMLASSFLLIDGDRFRMESPEAVYEGIFNIDVEPTPHRIDIDFVEGPEAGNRCEGIFLFDDDTDRSRLRICLGLAGSTRPTEFATSPGSGHALEDLERVQRARPADVDGGTAPPPPQPPIDIEPTTRFDDAPLTPTLEKLQGEWSALELVTSGRPLQQSYLTYGSRTQTGLETKVVFGGQTMLHAKVRIDEDTQPLHIDYLHLTGKSKGAVSRGLLSFNGDDETAFCIAAPGAERPDTIASAPGDGRTYSRWRRVPKL